MSVFKVPDMSCGHCESTIFGALKKIDPEVKVRVDLPEKLVEVHNLPDSQVEALLKDLGFTPEKVK